MKISYFITVLHTSKVSLTFVVQGNFILVHFAKKSADTASEYLSEQGIIVRSTANYGLPDALRFTIGTEDENTAVLAALKAFMIFIPLKVSSKRDKNSPCSF